MRSSPGAPRAARPPSRSADLGSAGATLHTRAMTGRRGLRWLLRRDPGLATSRRALRVAVVATAAFTICRYGVGDPVAAVYAAFGAIGFGVLSQVVGEPGQRTRTLLACFGVGTVLVTVGSLLSVSTWAATAGMLVIGSVIAFLPIGGPRPAGVANGLQLLYILPSFPPFAPETLPARILGLAVGMGLLAVADRLLWPPRPPRRYACRAAAAARELASLVHTLTTGAGDLAARRAAAAHAVERLRLFATPWEERPTGPGARDRGLAHLGAALRAVRGRVEALAAVERGRTSWPGVDGPLTATATSLRGTADALTGPGALPDPADLDAALAVYTDARRSAAATVDDEEAVTLARSAVAVEQVVAEQRVAVQSAQVVVDPRGRSRVARPDQLAWWTSAPTRVLWWRRVRGHLELRSVYLQNAVRLGVGLALARFVAGQFDLSHGLWVLLATLTLMRTSVTTTRASLVPAIVGTTAGAVVAAGLLALVGPQTVVYAVLFPLLCLVAVAAGPVLGAVAGQGCFTVLVAVLFAQVAPAGPSLAGARLLDVAVGAAIGIGVGAAVWPAGGHGEVRRDAALCLHAAADLLTASFAWLTGTGDRADVEDRLGVADHRILLFEATFLQFRSERRARHEDDVDWFTVLAVVHRTARRARTVLRQQPGPGPREAGADPPWPDLVARLGRDVHDVVEGFRMAADRLAATTPPPGEPAVPRPDVLDDALRALAAARDAASMPIRCCAWSTPGAGWPGRPTISPRSVPS